MKLFFSPANSKLKKLGKGVYSLDLSAGRACPGALECKSQAILVNGKPRIQDGPACNFRCFSAMQEVNYSKVREHRAHNFSLIKRARTPSRIRDLILKSLPDNARVIRYHVSGDFFSLNYLKAAIQVAMMRPGIKFYAYTKSLHHLAKLAIAHTPALSRGVLTPNFFVTASEGGMYDNYIPLLNMRTAKVVLTHKEALDKGLPLDNDDSHAANPGGSFALLLHGVQPAGTIAAKAWQTIKQAGGGYGR